jgi:hypothetical protein
MGVEEFVDHSFYEEWTTKGGPGSRTDPVGHPLSAHHPSNKQTPARADRPGAQVLLVHRPALGSPGDGDRRPRPPVDHGAG